MEPIGIFLAILAALLMKDVVRWLVAKPIASYWKSLRTHYYGHRAILSRQPLRVRHAIWVQDHIPLSIRGAVLRRHG